jgi:hypothetical protein
MIRAGTPRIVVSGSTEPRASELALTTGRSPTHVRSNNVALDPTCGYCPKRREPKTAAASAWRLAKKDGWLISLRFLSRLSPGAMLSLYLAVLP